MRRFRWPLLTLAVCLPLAVLAVGVPWPSFLPRGQTAVPRAVPDGDQEMAWLNTSTAAASWERVVTGLKRAEMAVPGLRVDDSGAFLDQSTAVPEVVLMKAGHRGKLRVRWYKLTSEATTAQWVRALAARTPAPLALIGGGSSDRALALAHALSETDGWHGDRPLLLVTMATADEVYAEADDGMPADAGRRLIDVYDRRTFRFCFTNRQMAEAVSDFVYHDPGLRPGPVVPAGAAAASFAAAGPWAAVTGAVADASGPLPNVFAVAWQDDPYSTDLSWQFHVCLDQQLKPPGPAGDEPMTARFYQNNVPFSVGGYSQPNRHEAAVAGEIAREVPGPGQRSLLVLPTVPAPARRLIRGLAEADPVVCRRLVAVTGDAISVNTIYRDGEFAWPVRALPVPLVMFTHHDPFGWDAPGGPAPPPGYALDPPTGTDDVLLYADLGRLVADAVFPPPTPDPRFAVRDGLVTRADHVAARLREQCPPYFDADGNRLGGTGEYVVVLRPNPDYSPDSPDATVTVYRRTAPAKGWEAVRTRPVFQTRKPSPGGPPG